MLIYNHRRDKAVSEIVSLWLVHMMLAQGSRITDALEVSLKLVPQLKSKAIDDKFESQNNSAL
jgi:hypothetical protein